ncbi:MAG: nucleoside-diphosphate kinase [Candidatus Liptonbacteria bacterium]|nr:nucleoside-diphosphate kinase [Candidatus Liptonbacteria bacterium]
MFSISLGILKPDCVSRGLEDEALRLVKASGLKIVFRKRIRLSVRQVGVIYDRCREKLFFSALVSHMTSGDSILFVVVGEDAVKRLNKVVGNTDPKLAKERTLRQLGESISRNIAHSSMDAESFEKEVEILLSMGELETIRSIN